MTKRREPEDLDLWHVVARTVKPYHPKLPKPPSPPKKAAAKKPESAAARPQKSLPVPKAAAPRGKEMDASTARKMKRGEFRPEGVLDLHGMTQAEAFGAFSRFIAGAVRAEKRNLIIITGKGTRGGGVLRRLLPLWAEEMAPHILGLSPARPKDGGEGAFYLRLRRNRE